MLAAVGLLTHLLLLPSPLQSVSQEAVTLHRQSTMQSSSSVVSVSHSPQQYLVKTSFYKCSWNLEMFRLGSAKEAAIGTWPSAGRGHMWLGMDSDCVCVSVCAGYANGGDIISLVQQGRSECLSVPLRNCDKVCNVKSNMPNL